MAVINKHEAGKWNDTCIATSFGSMTGKRYKPLHRPMRKVTYVEVKRKRGNIFKEVLVKDSPTVSSRAHSTPVRQPAAHPDFDGENMIQLVSSRTKVSASGHSRPGCHYNIPRPQMIIFANGSHGEMSVCVH